MGGGNCNVAMGQQVSEGVREREWWRRPPQPLKAKK